MGHGKQVSVVVRFNRLVCVVPRNSITYIRGVHTMFVRVSSIRVFTVGVTNGIVTPFSGGTFLTSFFYFVNGGHTRGTTTRCGVVMFFTRVRLSFNEHGTLPYGEVCLRQLPDETQRDSFLFGVGRLFPLVMGTTIYERGTHGFSYGTGFGATLHPTFVVGSTHFFFSMFGRRGFKGQTTFSYFGVLVVKFRVGVVKIFSVNGNRVFGTLIFSFVMGSLRNFTIYLRRGHTGRTQGRL